MSIYPSLEDMKVDQILQAQNQVLRASATTPQAPSAYPAPPEASVYGSMPPYPPMPSYTPMPTYPPTSSSGNPVYPGLADYMGMELTEDVIRENMPEYLPVAVRGSTQVASISGGCTMLAPLSSESPGFAKSQVTHGIRQVILCKDADSKVGLRVKSINKGIFVCLVAKGSPAAMGGLRFGDQILQINNENVAGYSESKVHDIIKKAGVNNIVLAVRDRPFERTLTLHKDSAGQLGFQFKEGKITAIVVDSSAARNGLLIEHNLLEVNGQNVVGVKDKEIAKIIDEGGQTVTITVVPSYLFDHMIKNMSNSLVKKMMDHSIPDM